MIDEIEEKIFHFDNVHMDYLAKRHRHERKSLERFQTSPLIFFDENKYIPTSRMNC